MTFISVVMASSILMYMVFVPTREEEDIDHDNWIMRDDLDNEESIDLVRESSNLWVPPLKILNRS